MSSPSQQPPQDSHSPQRVLRLAVHSPEQADTVDVNTDVAKTPNVRNARIAIAAENHLASALPVREGVSDEFVRQIVQSLEGGRAAVLRPHRRRALVAGGVGKGMRPFQVQLLLAGVQEAVRAGEIQPAPLETAFSVLAPTCKNNTTQTPRATLITLFKQGAIVFVLGVAGMAALIIAVLSSE